jgi:hypothetical protein
MEKALSRREPIHLSYRDGQVTVTPEDQDIFFLSAEKATEACRQAVRAEERVANFKREFLVPLRDWCVAHADRVSACYLPQPAGHLQVFVVTNRPRFDFQLSEEMAALGLRLTKAGWRVGVWQLPSADKESLSAFFNPEGALEVYAQRGSAPQEGGE